MMVKEKTFNRLDDLAIFGAEPLFSSPRPIGQLSAPPVDEFLALARRTFEARRFTGNGNFVQLLESDLADFHGVRHCIAIANAGLGLIMLAQLFAGGRRGQVIMPSFSYRGLPHIVRWAGQEPRFCDVVESTHGLDPRSVSAAIDDNTTCIFAVCNFNSPGDVAGLCRVAADAAIPIIFDSVDAVGGTFQSQPMGSFGRAEVFSLHATKMLNGFEGGYITTDDDDLARTLRWQRDGASRADRPPSVASNVVQGINARLNEIHAALAYLSLQRFESVVAGNRARYLAYQAICRELPGLELVPYEAADRERRNYRMSVVEVGEAWPLTREQNVAMLRAERVLINPYYSPALHRAGLGTPGAPIPDLPVTEALQRRFHHLPVGELVALEDIARLGELLGFVRANGEAVAARLKVEAT